MAGQRLISLDAFRGLTVAGMILVNNPGSWSHVYPPLRHAEWHGWTPTDLIFPFFLFIVGVSMSLSFARRAALGEAGGKTYLRIVRRSLLILGLGWFLHLFPYFRFSTMRLPGVLPRIALCFFFGSLIYLSLTVKERAAAVIIGLAVYWLAMKLFPVPGYGAGILEYRGNLCGYIDFQLLAGHLYRPEFDPEGLLSTLPAVATTLLGTLAGDWLRSKRSMFEKTAWQLAGGVVLTGAGLALQPFFPINKQLWSPTYVLFTAGMAAIVLAFCYVLMDGMGIKRWAAPFLVFGTNAIVAFAGSTLMVKVLALIKVSAGGRSLGLQPFVYQELVSPWAGKEFGSLLVAVGYVLLWMALMTPLYRKRVFIKL